LINKGKTLIFPNPAKDYIKIANFDPGDKKPVIQFFDISGKLCQETKLSNFVRSMKIPISLKPGMYITRLKIGETVHYVQKLIVVN
ncbi:MAG TPA: T9SS type A sorting domain-containing protein, partial [Bacteroidales bacterium]|nr:T9SS type A sorting domain-containing protein [Bacteroidales bacterium]